MEVKEKNQKLLIVVGILLLFGGVSLAYFVTKILTNGNGGSTSVTTAVIRGARVDVEGILEFEDLEILPGHKTVSAIKVTATGNNELIPYNLIWKGTNSLTTPLNFSIYKTSEEIEVNATCEKKTKMVGASKQLSEECTITNIDRLGTEIASGRINKNDSKVILAKDEFITAVNNGISYYYYVILEYPNLDEPQNEDLDGTFEGEVTVEESDIKPDINIIAAYVKQDDGEYRQVEDIPQEGYQLNTEKSTCSNGTIPGWDTKNKRFYADNLNKSGTSCYLYFDEYVPTASETILNNITINNGIPNFTNVATTDEGVYKVEDGMYGEYSYYWRGAVTNNYVEFANKCWRIIRINGDGSIRLIYDGTTCHANGTNTADSIAVQNVAYNTSSNQSYYVGWTYNSSQRPSTTNPQTGGTPSNAKTQLESWYNNNIGNNTEYSTKIVDGKFCNDRNTTSGYSWSSQPSSTLYYAARERLQTNKKPTLSCPLGDVYTLKVGLIAADEVAYAGGTHGTTNSSYYLCNGQYYWMMSPFGSSSVGSSYQIGVFLVGYIGQLTSGLVTGTFGLRPVINLRSDVTFSGGNGTLDNPYVVAD